MIGTAHASDPYDSGVGAKLLSGFNLIEECVFMTVRLTEDTLKTHMDRALAKVPTLSLQEVRASD